MQQNHSRVLRKNRIKSIVALSKSHIIQPSNKPVNLNHQQFIIKSLHHSSIKQNQNQTSQPCLKHNVEEVIRQMQFSINQITESIKIKTEKQKYLELRLNQILTKQNEKISNLQQKLLMLYEQQKQKDYEIQKLKQKIINTKISKQSISHINPKIIESRYSLPIKQNSCYQSPKFKSIEQINQDSTRNGTDIKQPLSPFTSQPID